MEPINPVVPVRDVDALLTGMKNGGFQGRRLGESLQVWKRMIEDPDCTIFLGLSGAMIPAGMQACLAELVRRRYVDVIVSTGANIFHDMCEHIGVRHYRGHHHVDDTELFGKGIDRIYDVFAYEGEFRGVDREVAEFAASLSPYSGSSRDFIERLSGHLQEIAPGGESLVSACREAGVPIFVPALSDSSIGIALVMARRDGADIMIDHLQDACEITQFVEQSKKTGVIYIGGGVPKNFIQQTQVIASIRDNDCGGHAYAIQYTTDAPHWGGLSGCTFEEAVSWGKESVDSTHVQVFCDATIALPMVVSGLISADTKRTAPPAPFQYHNY
jgi:deoxyhypusine synthase